ncbi:hypothetical protein SAMN05216548_106109 [Faunimonas pinastri]|uniref:DUF6460 domain-containing protein n=1 Tax=Faunimonas pinastri TaxID=1855383 RepID=A0A1H9HP45_9HYPH|nr:DUF6460 domain-containing protein [Faunimonas pinastri]SEQ64111.1 hypothetical protein SAMN05216548_106109 [Faunimonas pinastri]
MSGRTAHFLGDNPIRVLLRLIVLSFVVGLVLSVLHIHPVDIYYWAEDMVYRIWNMGFGFIQGGLGYLVVGAVIVVPLFLLSRLLKVGSGRAD